MGGSNVEQMIYSSKKNVINHILTDKYEFEKEAGKKE